MHAHLDETDRQILQLLQADGRMSNVELARLIGMSPPPALRRVKALEAAGFITGYRAMVDEKKLGFDVAFFAFVHLASQAGPDLEAFSAHVRAMPMVRSCWTLSGDMDFILTCAAPDMKAFQRFVAEMTALPNVRNVRTALALEKVKDEGAAPV
ncbi:MAG: Lrp/AsnC family transcriptional regulator [Bosea sp. (in: a-proteobacteria)]